MIFLLSRRLIFDFMSSYQSDSFDDESDGDGSDSGSSGTYSFCAFSLRFDDSVGSVNGLGSGIFLPTGVNSKSDIFAFYVFVPTGVEYRGGRLIEMFWRSNYLFYFQILNSVLYS